MASLRSIFFLIAVLLIGATAGLAVNPVRLMVDLSPEPDGVMLSAFDLCIVDAQAKVNLEAQQALGNKMLARVNVFEVPQDSPAAEAARSVGVPLLEATRKGCVRLDATHPHWVAVVVYQLVQGAAERGFDGFVLTGLETLSQDAERAACLRVIAEVDKAYPDKQLMIEGGLDLVPEARRWLEGALFLGDAARSPARDRQIREVKRLGVRPLVVDSLAADVSQEEIESRAQHYRAMGAVPFFTTPTMDGTHLGPLREVTRRVLVIHSGPARETFTAKLLHGSLEWMGYQVRYVDAGVSARPDWESELSRINGVILDARLAPLPEQQAALLGLVDHLKAHEVPLLITGAMWGNAEEFAEWAKRLGLRGSGKSLAVGTDCRVNCIENAWLQEDGAVRARSRGFRDLQAPAGARVVSSFESGEGKKAVRFDPVFLASWGGFWLDEAAMELGPQLQPLPFIENWLGQQSLLPVADVASQNGRRLMVPHISSEGFAAGTSLQGLPIAAEVMTERILSRYSLPFTVAVCEGDVRGINPGHEARDALRYETAARALFALPQVRAASASLSRPQDWSRCETMPREVAGSMAYIHRQLLPAGRRVELMLWPHGSPPTAEGVAFSKRMGVDNVQPQLLDNATGRLPPPAAMTWGRKDSFQSLAPGLRRKGPLDATSFISLAEAQGRGRWMAPVHVGLNFHDATSEESLWEVERVLDWCASQPLQAMSLTDHAKMVRDAAETRFFIQGPGHWIIVNAGHARTLRVPVSAGVPDLDRSIGIAGYVQRGGDLYIHTLGRRRTELVLSPKGSPGHLRLASSSGAVRYMEAGHQMALLQVADLRPVELVFAGIQPGAMCQIYTSEQPQFILADAKGQVEVTVPAQTLMRLQVLPAQQAAMR
ncbi:hypothetical protein WJU23_08890 [Prosthecobacter sp. SYSU 5D2]|uniref:hypothetical protein n=1 Tax=Prosthecobacter sp. SYSU 5D2 TaxID=3134134 RepID=UPI0031FE4C47